MHIDRAPRPATEVVSLADAKLLLRLDADDEDATVARLIGGALDAFEAAADLALINRQIVVTLDRWPGPAWLALPIAPVADAGAVTMTADAQPFDGFEVLTGLRPVLRLTAPAPAGLVQITYQAGFGATAATVPQDIRAAVLDQVLIGFDARGMDRAKGTGLSAHMARVVARYRRVAL